MFKLFKDKLKNWTDKIKKEKSEPEVEEKPVKVKEKKKGIGKKAEKKGRDIDEVLKEESEKIKEIPVPQKFEVGLQSVVPDTDKIKEISDELESEEEEVEKPGSEGFFKRITSKINKVKISEEEFEIYAEELEMLLLENNVALEVAQEIIDQLKERIVGKEFLKKEIEGQIKEIFRDIIEEILISPFDVAQKIREKDEKPYVALFCGINGTGKTTTIAKVADYLKHKGLSCVLAAGDTFRAASIEQLKTHGDKIGIKVIAHEYGSDPASVGFDAVNYAKKNKIDCVLIDTAGRMHTAKNLLKEMEKITRVCKPDLKVFVGESLTGNDAIEQVRSFDWAIGIDGIVLTKADIDEKGGTALSVGYVTKKPILYLGTGQEYDKIEPFDKKKFIERLGL